MPNWLLNQFTALQQPGAGHYMGAQDQPPVCPRRIHADAHAAGLTALLLGLTRLHDPDAKGSAGGVQTACRDRGPL